MSEGWDELPGADAPSEHGAEAEDDLEATTFYEVEHEELVFEITGETDPYGSWPTLDPLAPTPSEPDLPPGEAAAPSQAAAEEKVEPSESAEVAEETDDDVPRASPGPLISPSEGEALSDGAIAEEIASVEHVAGEIHVPDGYTVLEGAPLGHRRAVALVVSRFNGTLTDRLLARAIEALEDAGVTPDAVTIVPVPGAFELPLAAMALAKTRRYSCIVALGAIVRGETPHFDLVAGEAASGLQLAGIETGVPVAFGVLTVDTIAQAEARIDRAADAVTTALEMADMFARLRASSRAH